jgi:cobalt-zinc-cadmium efflux system membrane fusion protein
MNKRLTPMSAVAPALLLALGMAACSKPDDKAASAASAASAAPSAPDVVRLSDAQKQSIKVGQVALRQFAVTTQAPGTIDFNENAEVQVFSPYQGRIITQFVHLGDLVTKGQPLFTVESADYIQAESTLIAAAAVFKQTTSALARAKDLYPLKGMSQNDYEQAVANQQTAEGALKAAQKTMQIFGKTPVEVDRIAAARHVDDVLIVRSPISGRVTASNAAPGLLELPGNPPAPYIIADTSTVWMLANVTEVEIPKLTVGQPVTVSVTAYPDRLFKGVITALGAAIDPNTHRATIRSQINDPKHELRPGMLANFVISTAAPLTSPSVPMNGVVREGDGTMSVWVTNDGRQFTRRTVKIGLQQDDYDQVLDGLQGGETVAIDGAIFLSNIAFGGAS